MSLPFRWAVHTPTNQPTTSQLLLATRLIQKEELERISKFRFRRDAHSSLIGRLLLRKCVKDALKISNKDIQLIRDEYNKPVLVWPTNKNAQSTLPLSATNFHFNVSHQGEYVVLGADEVRVGVDVMETHYRGGKDVAEFFRLMDRQFSPNEWILIKKDVGNPEAQAKAFMRHWTLKESYVKAVGLGLNLELRRIEFETKSDIIKGRPNFDTIGKLDRNTLKNWTFEEHLLDEKHVTALAWERPPASAVELENPNFTMLTFQDLIEGQECLHEEEDEAFSELYFSRAQTPANF